MTDPVGVPQSEEAPKIKEWMREAEREIVADVRQQCRLWAGVYVAWNDDPDRWAKIMARHEAEAGPVEAPNCHPEQTCKSPYHRPTSLYCLDCLPSDAPLGALLLSNRKPTADDVKRGQEIAELLKQRGPVEAPLNKVQEWMRRAARHWSNVDNIVEEYAEIIAEEYWKAPGAQPLHVRSDREKEIVRKLRAEHDRLRSAAESSTEGGSLYAMAAKLNAVASEIERGE